MRYKIMCFILVTLFLFGTLMNLHINEDSILASIKDKIIRLHVVANSDSPEDQAIKLHIRDVILEELKPKMGNFNSPEEVKNYIKSNLDNLKIMLEEEMKKIGKNYPIEIELGNFEFPTKVYGPLSFPAGNYQALNVKIGEAKGKNWWCVMFPPLCFVDIAQGVVSENVLEEFKEILDEEELELLKSGKNDKEDKENEVKIKFKLVEMAKSINKNFAKLIGKD